MSKNRRRKRSIGIFFVFNIILVFFLLFAFGREYIGNRQIQREIALLEEEREALEGDQVEVLGLIDELSSEYYLEKEARTKYGLGLPGETVVVLQDSEDSISQNENLLEITSRTARDRVKIWYYYFFDKERFVEIQNSTL